MRSIEHGIYLDDEAIEMMLAEGTWLVPTLHAPRAVIAGAAAGAALPPAVVEKAHLVQAAHDDSIRRAHAAGVKIAMGTDCGVGKHGTNLDELGFMREVGMSSTEVLHATTQSAAQLLGSARGGESTADDDDAPWSSHRALLHDPRPGVRATTPSASPACGR